MASSCFHQAGLDGVADRRVGDRLQLHFAALAGDEDFRVADVVRADRAILDFDESQRGGGSGSQFANRLVCGFDAVEDGRPQVDRFAVFRLRRGGFLQRFLNGFDRQAAGPFAAGVAAQAIGNREDAAGGAHRPDGGDVFVRCFFLRRACAEDGCGAAQEIDRGHVGELGFDEQARRACGGVCHAWRRRPPGRWRSIPEAAWRRYSYAVRCGVIWLPAVGRGSWPVREVGRSRVDQCRPTKLCRLFRLIRGIQLHNREKLGRHKRKLRQFQLLAMLAFAT